VIKNLEYNLIL